MSVKLYYFDARGLCEPIRMIFHVGGVEYEEVRISMATMPPTIPPEIKEKLNWGQVPMVEFDGRKLCQSMAITRYFAKKCNLAGSDDFEAALCDEYADATREVLQVWVASFLEKDPAKKKELVQQTFEKIETRYLKKFNEIVLSNDGKHLVGNRLSWPDICLASCFENVELRAEIDLTKNYPGLRALRDNVFAHPDIKAWREKRPNSTY